jgi:hypothetical protein
VTGLTLHVVTWWLSLLILEEKIDDASFLRAASVLSREGRTRKVDVRVLTSEKRVDLNFITHLGTVTFRLRWDYTRASGSGEAHPNGEMITIDFMFTVPARYISVIRQATGYSVH